VRVLRVASLTLAVVTLAACAGSVVPGSPDPVAREALLVLPGFGYSNDAERVLRRAQASLAADGIDLYAPSYVEREGIDESREELREFIDAHGLARYGRLHVFAFIAGAWTLNPLLDSASLPNLASVIYDRSPLQERAPRIADEKLRFLTWLRYGRPVFDVARRPYPPLASTTPRIGVLIETKPTPLIRRFARTALSYGPLRFDCGWTTQRHDDCAYVDLNHDELYTRFMDVLPEVLVFMRSGRFSAQAVRTAPAGNPLGPGADP